jgi:hypothetical protein
VIVTTLCDLVQVIHDADPADKAELYSRARVGRRGVAGYQDAIYNPVTTTDPGGCAPAHAEFSVDVIS